MSKHEFDIEEDYEEVVVAKENKAELNEVVNNYKRILSEHFVSKVAEELHVDKKREESKAVAAPFEQTMKIDKGLMVRN